MSAAEIYTSFNTGLEPVTPTRNAESLASFTTIEWFVTGYATIG